MARDPYQIGKDLDAAKAAFRQLQTAVEERRAPYVENQQSLHESIQLVCKLESELSTSRGYIPPAPLLNRTEIADLLEENRKLREALDARAEVP